MQTRTTIEDYFLKATGSKEDFLNTLNFFEKDNDMTVSRELLLQWSLKNKNNEALKAVVDIISVFSEREIKSINLAMLTNILAATENWSEKMEILDTISFFKKLNISQNNQNAFNPLNNLLVTNAKNKMICDTMVKMGLPGILDGASIIKKLQENSDFESLTDLLNKGYIISLNGYNENKILFELNDPKKLKDYLIFSEKLFSINNTAQENVKNHFASKFFANIFSSNLIDIVDFENLLKDKNFTISQFVNHKIPHQTYGSLIDINSSDPLFNNLDKAKYILKKAINESEKLRKFIAAIFIKRICEKKDKEAYLALIDREVPDIKEIIKERSDDLVTSVIYNGSLSGLIYLNSHIGDIKKTHDALIKDSIEYYYRIKVQSDLKNNLLKEWPFIKKMFLNKDFINDSFSAFVPDKMSSSFSYSETVFPKPETWFSIACHAKDKKRINEIIKIKGFDLGANIMVFLNSLNSDKHSDISSSQISILKNIEALQYLPFENLLSNNHSAESINVEFEKNKLHSIMQKSGDIVKPPRSRL